MNTTKLNQIDHQYHDVLKAYDPNDRQMRYMKQFSQPIVEHANEYKLCFDRFRIPMTSVPLLIFNPAPNFYTFELVYKTFTSGLIPITYIPSSVLSISHPFYYYIFSFNLFIKMINNALLAAYNALDIASGHTLPASAQAPYFQIDYTINMLSLVVQSTSYDHFGVDPINIYACKNFITYCYGIPSEYTDYALNGRHILFTPMDSKNNTITISGVSFYNMMSESGQATLIKWNICVGFVITSDLLPINMENIPTGATQSLLLSRGIVSNFDLVFGATDISPLVAQYILQSPYKEIDMISNDRITAIDFTVFWYDSEFNLYPCYLLPSESMSLRIVFIRK